jgi:hypothetical protein
VIVDGRAHNLGKRNNIFETLPEEISHQEGQLKLIRLFSISYTGGRPQDAAP